MTTTKAAPTFAPLRIVGACLFLSILQVLVLFLEHAKSSRLLFPSGTGGWSSFQARTDYADPSSTTFNNNDTDQPSATYHAEPVEEFIPLAPLSASENDALPHPRAGSRFPHNGTLGYVADPMALRRSVAQYGEESYLKRITELHSRYRKGSLYGDTTILDPEGKFGICNVGPGRSLEDEGGFKLLTEKIQVQPLTENSPRILCVMYSYRKMRDLLRMQALTWGHQCDGFLAFSTETIPELGIVEILHKGEESYQNMWQKVRSIWTYLYTHYRNDFDYFHLGGDDLYLIVNNLRHFLVNTVESRKTHPQEPVFLGSLVKSLTKEPSFVAGAPGYTLNRHSLSRFVEQALDNCATTQVASHEDRLMSKCLQSIGILPGDTRDVRTGEPQYHDANPHHLYTFRTRSSSSFHAKIALRWEDLPHPSQPNATVGPKHGLEAAARYSIAFHDIYHPLYVARIHVLLHPEICPATTILGRALRMYGIVSS